MSVLGLLNGRAESGTDVKKAAVPTHKRLRSMPCKGKPAINSALVSQVTV